MPTAFHIQTYTGSRMEGALRIPAEPQGRPRHGVRPCGITTPHSACAPLDVTGELLPPGSFHGGCAGFSICCLRPARYSAGDCPPRVFRRAGARALPFPSTEGNAHPWASSRSARRARALRMRLTRSGRWPTPRKGSVANAGLRPSRTGALQPLENHNGKEYKDDH